MAELPNLFAAIERLAHDAGDEVHVCLLLDGCVDGSAALAASFAADTRLAVRIEDAPRGAANAGLARRRAMALGLEATGGEGLLLTTDADTVPAPDWLLRMKTGLAEAEIVAGRIVRAGARHALQDRIEGYYDALFALRRRIDPVPWEAPVTHHCVGGANLGVRADAYDALGGFAPLPSGEDARFVDDGARAGLRVRRDAACLVATSARRDGRAGGGLAASLRHLDGAEAAGVPVAHPADAAWQYRMHALARAAHAGDRLDRIAGAIGLTADHALGVARDCANAEAFAMRLVPEPPGGMRTVPLPVAERELARLSGLRRAA